MRWPQQPASAWPQQDDVPTLHQQEAASLLRALSTAAGFVLYLPWQVFSYFFRPADAPPLELADRSLQLLLVLTQHLPPALFAHSEAAAAAAGGEVANEFLKALRSFSDDESRTGGGGGAEAAAAADPERGGGGGDGHQLSFRELHDAIAAALPAEESVLLVYLLLHGNREFLDYCITRTDADALLLPLLRPLYEVRSLRPNQLYMLLIVILMLSQDHGFIATAQSVVLPSVPQQLVERALHPVGGQRLVRLPGPSEGSGRACAPQSAASAAWRFAGASAARPWPIQS